MTGNLFYWLMETKSWIFTGQDEIKNKIILPLYELYDNLVIPGIQLKNILLDRNKFCFFIIK
jgi:hypothetical protein